MGGTSMISMVTLWTSLQIHAFLYMCQPWKVRAPLAPTRFTEDRNERLVLGAADGDMPRGIERATYYGRATKIRRSAELVKRVALQ